MVADGLTLDLPRGVVAGFVGPHAAGRTTTMAPLVGLATPTAGTGAVLGRPLEHPSGDLGREARSSRAPPRGPG